MCEKSALRIMGLHCSTIWSGLGVGIIIFVGFSHSTPLLRMMA